LNTGLESLVEISARGPDVELVRELGNDEERAPAADLLGLEDVAVDVVAAVQHVAALRADQRRKHVAASCISSSTSSSSAFL